jgi:DNA modification methylase
VKPYYEHGGITIYHGDCREVLAALAADSVDLIVTDPPYGVDWQSNVRLDKHAKIVGDADASTIAPILADCMRVLRSRRHIYVFGPFDISVLPRMSATTEIVWDKQVRGLGNLAIPWAPSHERIAFGVKDRGKDRIPKGGLVARMRRESVLHFTRTTSANLHPTEKPVALLRELIEASSQLTELVIDPFSGVGSTLVAASREGRRAIGIEIEERYCEIAAKRLQQEVLPLEVAG